MTKDEIMKLANEAAMRSETFVHYGFDGVFLEAFANLVAAHKAEVITAEAYRCGYKDGIKAAAIVCENVDKSTHPADLAAVIRARGNT
jgi:hypothetical protein